MNQDELEQQVEESLVFHLGYLTSVDMIHSNSFSIVFDV